MTFLVTIEYNKSSNVYSACYDNGETVELQATNYHDAICEADMLENIELGYN
jgi:hypothetical protein